MTSLQTKASEIIILKVVSLCKVNAKGVCTSCSPHGAAIKKKHCASLTHSHSIKVIIVYKSNLILCILWWNLFFDLSLLPSNLNLFCTPVQWLIYSVLHKFTWYAGYVLKIPELKCEQFSHAILHCQQINSFQTVLVDNFLSLLNISLWPRWIKMSSLLQFFERSNLKLQMTVLFFFFTNQTVFLQGI